MSKTLVKLLIRLQHALVILTNPLQISLGWGGGLVSFYSEEIKLVPQKIESFSFYNINNHIFVIRIFQKEPVTKITGEIMSTVPMTEKEPVP